MLNTADTLRAVLAHVCCTLLNVAVNDGGKLCEEIKELVGGRKNRTKHLRASIFANQRVDFFLNVFVKRYDIVQSVQNVAFLLRNSRCLVFDFIQQVEKAFDKAIIRQRKGDRLSLVVDFKNLYAAVYADTIHSSLPPYTDTFAVNTGAPPVILTVPGIGSPT